MAHRFRSYARFLQKNTDMSYQRAVQFIEQHWDEVKDVPNEQRRQWLLDKAQTSSP
jgi:hypothetical protein